MTKKSIKEALINSGNCNSGDCNICKENEELKARLFCTKESCDNCGFVLCENFQRQRKSEPCGVYISYKDKISKMELQLNEAKEIVKKFLLWENAWHDKTESKYELLKEAEQFLKEVEK